MASMKNNEIIEQIKRKLTGQKEKDIPFLEQEIRKYQSENNFELAMKIQILLFNYLPEEEKVKLNEGANNMLKEHKNKYNEALEHLNYGDIDRAKNILVELFNTYLKVSKIMDSCFFDFSEPIEHFIYFGSFQELKKANIKKIPEPVVHYAYQIASIYLEQGDNQQAIAYLEKALIFNPVCEYVLQELIERYLSISNYEQAFIYIKRCLKNAYTKKQLAYGYNKLGQYFRNCAKYDKAIASFAVSNLYEDDLNNKIAIKEITAIAGQIKFSSADQLIALFKEEDINYGPSKHVIQTFANFIDYAKASKDKKTLGYVCKIAYELTDEKYYQDIIK